MNLRVRFDHLDLVFKVDWAVTLDLKLLVIGLTDGAGTAHVDEAWEELVLLRINDRKRMDWDQNFVAIAVNPHRVVVVLVLVHSRCELNVDVF